MKTKDIYLYDLLGGDCQGISAEGFLLLRTGRPQDLFCLEHHDNGTVI